jgi:hypothetical protein
MDFTGTPSTLRERLMANRATATTLPVGSGAPALDDPFAGEDELWADEDWAHWIADEDESGKRFFSGLIVGAALAAVGWFALASAAILAYRLIT